jgi:hypothetical protein
VEITTARSPLRRTTTPPPTAPDQPLGDQLDRLKRAVSFDMYDMTVRQLVDMFSLNEINTAPEYQRHFIWDEVRESELIESIYLGIPVPSLYMATNQDATWEVVDGVQRISTLVHFVGEDRLITKIGKTAPLVLRGLTKLTSFQGQTFVTLPRALQLQFSLRPVRVTTLNDKSDFSVRYDLFERLNTGGVELHPQEIRNCVFRGPFKDLIKRLSTNEDFRHVVLLRDSEQQTAEYEECVLRFFAFFEKYTEFEHSVVQFLNDYMIERNRVPPDQELVTLFERTMSLLAGQFPRGIARGRTTTPLNLYEAVAVGTGLAVQRSGGDGALPLDRLPGIVSSPGLRRFTQGGTNSRRMVTGRIEHVRDALLN